ncbi:MAG: HupE/UreJ family protein, partial [Planctomycetota bacterium]
GTTFRQDLTVTPAEVEPEIARIEAYLYDRVTFAIAGSPVELKVVGFELDESVGRQFLRSNFEFVGVTGIPDEILVGHRLLYDVDDTHRGFFLFEHFFEQGTLNNEGSITLVFTPDDTRKLVDLTDRSVWRGLKELIHQGIEHILIGTDHILFLIVLLLTSVVRRAGRREDDEAVALKGWVERETFGAALIEVLKIVTAFTVSHSITLSLAALGILRIDAQIIESIIALSIAVAAVDVFYPVFRGRTVLVVLVFGLFHGFGFANVLEPLGVAGSDLGLSLLGFNIGVEVGQLMIVAVAFPMLFMMRKSRLYTRFTIYLGAAFSIFVAVYWFIERAFDVDLTLGEKLHFITRYL